MLRLVLFLSLLSSLNFVIGSQNLSIQPYMFQLFPEIRENIIQQGLYDVLLCQAGDVYRNLRSTSFVLYHEVEKIFDQQKVICSIIIANIPATIR